MIKRLANIGAGGVKHANDNLMKLLQDCGVDAQLTQPLGMTDLLLLPSTLIRLLHQHYPANFRQLLGADKGLVSNFWQGFLAIPANQRWA
jgi:hypothetical protein